MTRGTRTPSAGLTRHYADILKHFSIYGVGQILGRLASVLLLPLYTRYLSPADYGVIAIIDLTTGMLGILVGGGMGSAVSRYHFEAEDAAAQSAVWWTGLAAVTLSAAAIVVPGLWARQSIANLTLGPQGPSGGHFYALALATLWLSSVAAIPSQYLLVRKWSWLTVSLSIGLLALNVVLNVYFLTVLQLGVAGLLWGNLITSLVSTLVQCGVLALTCRPLRLHMALAGRLMRFGGPLVIFAVLSMMMHQADRYVLRLLLDLNQVGVYALAYTIGQGVNSALLTPFFSVWDVVVYEVADRPDARRVYVQVFDSFVRVLLLLMLGVSLFSQPVVSRFLPPEYAAAGWLIPIVCLAFVFFSLHGHFRVPAMLTKQTGRMVLPPAVAATANVLLNLLLIPLMGVIGAALTSVATYAIFSFVGLWQYRRIAKFDYPFKRCGLILLAMIGSFEGCEVASTLWLSAGWSLGVRGLVWSCWAFALLVPMLKRLPELTARPAPSLPL